MRVFVVEDEAMLSILLEDFLEDLGCVVVGVAARLEDALEMARTMTIDMAVLDVNLAGKHSYPVAHMLRQRNIPFVFATGYGAAELTAELQDELVLSKPFHQAQLASILAAAWARQRERQPTGVPEL